MPNYTVDRFYDSTPLPKSRRFSSANVFMAARHKEGCCEKDVFVRVLICKGLSNDAVGAIPGDTAGRWFENRRLRQRKVRGGLP